MQEIEIKISPNGEVEFHIQGVKGKKCADILKHLEALGQKKVEQNTGEYFEEVHDTVTRSG